MKTQAAAIEFGTSKVVTVFAESGGFARCEIIGSGTVYYDGYKGGVWSRPDLLAEAVRNSINAAELEAKTRIHSVYVGVPCEYIQIRVAEAEVAINSADERVGDDQINAVQDAAADKLRLADVQATVIHRSPAWFSVDGGKHTMSILGVRGKRLRASVSFILADPAFMEDICELLSMLGITVMGFMAPVLGQTLLMLPLEERDRSCILIDAGYLNTEITVAEGDAAVYHAVLPLGGGNITADIAYDLQLDMRDAEHIKRTYQLMPDPLDAPKSTIVLADEYGSRIEIPRNAAREAIERSLNEQCALIEKTVREASAHTGPRSQIYLTGGGIAMMNGGREYLANKLGRPVRSPASKAVKLNTPNYTSILGLVDLVFDSIEQRTPQDESLPGRLKGGLKGMFAKK